MLFQKSFHRPTVITGDSLQIQAKKVYYLIYKRHVYGLSTRSKPSRNPIQQPAGREGRVSGGLDPRLWNRRPDLRNVEIGQRGGRPHPKLQWPLTALQATGSSQR